MAIVYTCNIIEKLKEKGYSTYRLREEKIIGQGALQKIREGKLLSWHELETVCKLLECQPGDLVEYKAEAPSVE